MSNTSVDWKIFEYKFSANPNDAFERFAYTLFCYEFNQSYGIFRYFNQPYIETQPVQTVDGQIIGFQAKYYEANTSLSSRKTDLINAIKGAKIKYAGINKLVVYTNKEFSTSTKKTKLNLNIRKKSKDMGVIKEFR